MSEPKNQKRKGVKTLNERESQRTSGTFGNRRPPQGNSTVSTGRGGSTSQASTRGPQTTANNTTGTTGFQSPKTVKVSRPGPTHDQISLRARAIWLAKGCKPGQDRENWLEAEKQLKAEMGVA
jgi:hypothetical protein